MSHCHYGYSPQLAAVCGLSADDQPWRPRVSRHFSTIGFHTSFFLVGAFKTFYALVREKRCCCAHSERRCQLGGTDAGSRAQFGFIPMTSDDERREGGVDPLSGGFVPRCRPIGRHAFAIACGFARRAGKALTAGGFDPPSGGSVPRRRPFGRRALSSPVALPGEPTGRVLSPIA